jgi:hypothetical protein
MRFSTVPFGEKAVYLSTSPHFHARKPDHSNFTDRRRNATIRQGVFLPMAKPKLRIVKTRPAPKSESATVGKRIRFDRDTWNAVEVLAQDQMKDIPEIIEEALRDLLKKHGRSADFRQQLRMSAKTSDRTSEKTRDKADSKTNRSKRRKD